MEWMVDSGWLCRFGVASLKDATAIFRKEPLGAETLAPGLGVGLPLTVLLHTPKASLCELLIKACQPSAPGAEYLT